MKNCKSLSSELKNVTPSFRKNISHAEDKVDLLNCFSIAAIQVVKKSIKNTADIRIDDITLDIKSPEGYSFSERIKAIPEFKELLDNTDIEAQISLLAEAAKNRCRHRSRHPEKTKLKIRQR